MNPDKHLLTHIKAYKLPGLYDIKKIWNPSWFQGNRQRSNYFEGWYNKLVDASHEHAWAFIPGITLHKADKHAFVQAINGKTGQTWYLRYPLEQFRYSRKAYYAEIGRNRFSRDFMELDIDRDDAVFKGRIDFEGQVGYSATLRRPGIMGWYRYMPFMQCYHGVVSMNHKLSGRLQADGQPIDFTNGKGYIEKDWGSAMPKNWIWMQCNHFERENVSFMLSMADVPWIGKSFPGFLGFLLLDGKTYHFATYTGARISKLQKEKNEVSLSILAKGFQLNIHGRKDGVSASKGALKAPVEEGMARIIHENINARLHLTLTDRRGELLFEGTGLNAGLEIVDPGDSPD